MPQVGWAKTSELHVWLHVFHTELLSEKADGDGALSD